MNRKRNSYWTLVSVAFKSIGISSIWYLVSGTSIYIVYKPGSNIYRQVSGIWYQYTLYSWYTNQGVISIDRYIVSGTSIHIISIDRYLVSGTSIYIVYKPGSYIYRQVSGIWYQYTLYSWYINQGVISIDRYLVSGTSIHIIQLVYKPGSNIYRQVSGIWYQYTHYTVGI